jgi:hypothetical protein
VAAIMHNVGSLMVIFNSARLVRKGEELEHYQPAAIEPPSSATGQKSGAAPELSPKLA